MLRGRAIRKGKAKGIALVSSDPISFFAGVDPETGVVVEKGHPLEGKCIAGRILVFPTGKGSTVGSYTLYRLAKKGLAPAAIINAQSDPVVAVGAIISDIPMVDGVDISRIETGDLVSVNGEVIEIEGKASLRSGDELIFLKLGGSLITDKAKAFTAREEVIRRAAREVKRALASKPRLRLLLGHGSGSFGHFVAKRFDLLRTKNWRGYAETGAAAARLNRLVADIFLEEGVPIVSIQPSASALCRDGKLVHLEVHPIKEALIHGLVPLVYGDVAMDKELGCTIVSTEQIFAYLARKLRPQWIILAGRVDGVFTADPLVKPEARPIEEITPENFAMVEEVLAGSHGVDVTGGMLSKVRIMYQLVQDQPSIRIRLISGERPGLIEKSISGEYEGGTLIAAHLPSAPQRGIIESTV